jgi:hypothetical protein
MPTKQGEGLFTHKGLQNIFHKETNIKKYGMYKGKWIEEMTKEELMEALEVMGNLYQSELLNKLK